MGVVTGVARMREASAELRARGEDVAFVPTMGALHPGHLRLVERARELARRVVLSVFVNPTQFGPGEDFAAYPRDLDRDQALARGAGADLFFAPAVEEMYPADARTTVEVGGLGEGLCGKSRPGHFRGVATVVLKLLHIVAPRFLLLGEKDYQQLAIVRRMVRDLDLAVEVVGVETVREADGLAMSSRNAYLTPGERTAATVLHRALQAALEAHAGGERRPEALVAAMRAVLAREPLARIEYAEVVDAESLAVPARVSRPALAALAVRIGETRLIDNRVLAGGAGREG